MLLVPSRLTLGNKATSQAESQRPELFLPDCNRRVTALEGLDQNPYDFTRDVLLTSVNGKAPDDRSPTRDSFTYRGAPETTNLGFAFAGGELEYSIGIWLKSVQTQPNFAGIVHAEQGDSLRFGMLTGGSGLGTSSDIFATIAAGSNTWAHTTSQPLQTGRLVFLLWVFNGAGATDLDRIKVFVNGQQEPLQTSGNIPTTMPGPNAPLNIAYRGRQAGYGVFNCFDCFTILRDVSPLVEDLFNDGLQGFKSLQKKTVFLPQQITPSGNLTGEGGLEIGGEGRLRAIRKTTGAGGLEFGGVGTLRAKPTGKLTGEGGVSIGGTGQLRDVQRITGAGGLEIGSSGVLRNAQTLVGAAGLSIGGTGLLRDGSTLNGQGGLTIGGEGLLGFRVALKGAAGLGFGGVGLLRDAIAPTAVHIDNFLSGAVASEDRLTGGKGTNRLTGDPEGKS